MTTLKAGARLKSAVCDTEVMVIRTPAGELDLQCGGVPMGPPTGPRAETQLAEAQNGGTLIGKRYVNEDESLELLCTKGGKGAMSLGAVPLEVKQAKQLPSSD